MTSLGLHPSAARFPELDPSHALFLDIDGTLAELTDAHDAAYIPAEILVAIDIISEKLNGALAIVSGRSMTDIDRMCGERQLPAAGQHGLEIRGAGGKLRGSVASNAINDMRTRVADLQTRYPALLVEHKSLSVAVHYRHAPHLQGVTQQALGHAVEQQGNLRLIHGKMVSEIALNEADKGVAIRELMGEAPFLGRVPVFIGDDVTDEDGFRIVNELGGISGKVGRGKTAAFYRFRDIADVRDWLMNAAIRFQGQLQASDIA